MKSMIKTTVAVATALLSTRIMAQASDSPEMNYPPDTISTCTAWYNNYEGRTCHDVRDVKFAITPETFNRWNPSVGLDCSNWQALSYCIFVESERDPMWTTSKVVDPRTIDFATYTTSHRPAPTAWEPLGCLFSKYNGFYRQDTYTDGDHLTIEKCEEACKLFTYSGVKSGTECWCGDHIATDWYASNKTDCNLACSGDKTQSCGGTSALNVFSARTRDPMATGTQMPTTQVTSGSRPSASTSASQQPDSSKTGGAMKIDSISGPMACVLMTRFLLLVYA